MKKMKSIIEVEASLKNLAYWCVYGVDIRQNSSKSEIEMQERRKEWKK